MVCLYHCDDDGMCAGSLVYRFGQKDHYPDAYFEMDYTLDTPFDRIHENEVVYIVDFSIDPKDMLKILEITKNVVWIDHHISAIERYKEFPYELRGIRSTKYSGCMLTYMYLKNKLHLLDTEPKELAYSEEIPYLVRVCDDYDLWRFNLPETKRFHAGFSLIPHKPYDSIWSNCSEDKIDEIISNGKAVIKYRANLMKELVFNYGFECKFQGFYCFVLNQGLISSDDFDSIDTSKYDILIGYIYDGTQDTYVYSLRSAEGGPDVRKIAESFGGGGHPHAAGFTSTSMILNAANQRRSN